MSEGTKTGIFWGVALASVLLGVFVSLPSQSKSDDGFQPGSELFPTFKDPLVAASMKIITFDEEQGQLETFEISKDPETSVWTIPSRDGYPADAVDQMKDAANVLVGIKGLDIQTANAEDHDDLGVVEPKIEKLQVGDEGVGRLVSFRDESQKVLASLIVGDPVKGDETKRYVRIPNQDPVYVVKFDDSPLTTQFTDWIEDDLLKLSSIDIENIEIKSYTASLSAQGVSPVRKYTANLGHNNSKWTIEKLVEFDSRSLASGGKEIAITDDAKLNETKLNELKNALDDLKIVGVFRKPEGVSATLRASEDLTQNNEAVTSLAQKGFYPVAVGLDGEADIISANGELSVSLQDGVKYILRFGNVSGVGQGDDEDDEDGGSNDGLNRYLFVTTVVDEDKFPVPELAPIPQSLEEYEESLKPKTPQPTADTDAKPEMDAEESSESEEEVAEKDETAAGEMKDDEQGSTEEEKKETEEESTAQEDPQEEAATESESDQLESATTDSDENSDADESKEPETAQPETPQTEPESSESDDPETDNSETEETGSDEPEQESDEPEQESDEPEQESDEPEQESGETTVEGEGSASGTGQAQTAQQSSGADKSDKEPTQSDSEATADASKEDATQQSPSNDDDAKSTDTDITEEERQEKLESIQEKITKSNQRKLDLRRDKIKAAEKRVADLNTRFSDWYYVIPEKTYVQLRIKREELFADDAEPASPAAGQVPQMNFNLPNMGAPGVGN